LLIPLTFLKDLLEPCQVTAPLRHVTMPIMLVVVVAIIDQTSMYAQLCMYSENSENNNIPAVRFEFVGEEW